MTRPIRGRMWISLPLLFVASTVASAATLTGTVKSNASVAVANVDIDAIDQCSGDNIFIATDHTAADGTFSITVPNGTYDLHFVPPAGSPLVAGDIQGRVVTASAALGTIILSPGPLVSGTLLTPAASAMATADLKFVNAVSGLRVFLSKIPTDAAGHWSVRVPAGTWDIDFRPPVGSAFADVLRRSLVVGTTDISGLSDVLKTGFAVTGVVRDRNNAPLKNVDLSAFDTCTGEEVPNAHDNTDANGAFSIVVPAGTFTFTVSPPACKLSEASRIPDLPVSGPTNLGTFTMRDAVTVSGIVRNPDGTPMVDARLKFYDTNLTGVPRQGTTRDHTSATGSFAVAVPNGTYDINIEPPVGSGARVFHVNNLPVNGDTNAGTLTALAGVAITSHIQGPGAVPLDNININVHDSATGRAEHLAHDATDAGGNYRVVVATGTYDIQYLSPACFSMAPMQLSGLVISANTALPTANLLPGIHLTGTVADAVHTPLANVIPEVFPPGGTQQLFTNGALTALNGSFDVVVPAGKYDIHYLPPAGTRSRAVAVALPTESASAALAPVTLPNGLLLSGAVRDATTLAALAGVRIELHAPTSATPMLTANDQSGATGAFSFPVDAGTWDIRYVPPVGSNYAEAWRRGVAISADLVLPLQSMSRASTDVPPQLPSALALGLPQPNPVHGEVSLTFQAAHGPARLSVWDVSGRLVATLWDGPTPGPTTVRWNARSTDGRAVAPGIYLVRLSDSTGGRAFRRLALVP